MKRLESQRSPVIPPVYRTQALPTFDIHLEQREHVISGRAALVSRSVTHHGRYRFQLRSETQLPDPMLDCCSRSCRQTCRCFMVVPMQRTFCCLLNLLIFCTNFWRVRTKELVNRGMIRLNRASRGTSTRPQALDRFSDSAVRGVVLKLRAPTLSKTLSE